MTQNAKTIFVSYRHSDCPDVAESIAQKLGEKVGSENVFIDSKSMLVGADFRDQSIAEVASAHSLIVIIGPDWLNATYQKGEKRGTRRLDDEHDVVRREIETAFERKMFVYPLLTNGATRPRTHELPASLSELTYRLGGKSDSDMDSFIDNVVANLRWITLTEAILDPPPQMVTVSLKRFFGHESNNMRLNVYQQFGTFCDQVFQRVDSLYPAGVSFPEYGYGRDWWLEKDGVRIRHAREIEEPIWDKFLPDSRPVVQVVAKPEETLDLVLASHMPRPNETSKLRRFTRKLTDRGSDVKRAADAIRRADVLLITAGAGMGVDSGLPDFRGDEGFWRAYPSLGELGIQFEEAANPKWFVDDPELAWGFYGHRLNLYRGTNPHHGFNILRSWCNEKEAHFVFTSNVDGQFQKQGFEWENIVECHGSIHHLQCLNGDCGEVKDSDFTDIEVDKDTFRAIGELPECDQCGCLMRPNIYMFEDYQWNRGRFNKQIQQYNQVLDEFRGSCFVVVECGAGKAVPTVRLESEKRAGTLIRINPRESEVPLGHLSFAAGALETLEKIDEQLANSK